MVARSVAWFSLGYQYDYLTFLSVFIVIYSMFMLDCLPFVNSTCMEISSPQDDSSTLPSYDVGLAGNLFGLPKVSADDADVVIVPVPWDVTTSYRPGTSGAPNAILEASSQIDYYVPGIRDTTSITYGMTDSLDDIATLNKTWRSEAEKIIHAQEQGLSIEGELADTLARVNSISSEVNDRVRDVCRHYLDQDKTVVLLGGDHSTPLGFMQALAEKFGEYGVLHIDAHADLRVAYEGFKYSHASIMYNAAEEIPSIGKFVQVGIRDVSEAEVMYAKNSSGRIDMYQYEDIFDRQAEGKTWKEITDEIVNKLPQQVYISFDIDGLKREYCPSTGTPVPGGLEYQQAIYIIKKILESGKKIIGADLNEVGFNPEEEWDSVVGMRMLFRLCVTAAASQGKLKHEF